jgi:hypothetical protein
MRSGKSPDHGEFDGLRTDVRETVRRHAIEALGSEEKAERWLGKAIGRWVARHLNHIWGVPKGVSLCVSC